MKFAILSRKWQAVFHPPIGVAPREQCSARWIPLRYMRIMQCRF